MNDLARFASSLNLSSHFDAGQQSQSFWKVKISAFPEGLSHDQRLNSDSWLPGCVWEGLAANVPLPRDKVKASLILMLKRPGSDFMQLTNFTQQ